MNWIVTFFDVSFIAAVNVIMEWVFKSKSKELVGAFEFKSDSSNDCSVCSPAHWDATGGVEKSWTNFSSFEIFLESSLFHVPSDDFNNVIRLVSDFDLMKTITIPVVSLSDVPAVEVVLGVVVVPKVVGRVDESASHLSYPIKIYLMDK